MRIVSGKARGRKLLTPPPDERAIRPTSDRAREALFSILGKTVDRAKVLDLFAGTGALGLEAFSRGADIVVFVDNDRQALELVRRNIALLFANAANSALRVVDHDLGKSPTTIDQLSRTLAGFDLIFADPPYGQGLSQNILAIVDKGPWLAENGMLVIEERFSILLPKELTRLRQIDQRRYGEAGLWFYQALGRPIDR